MQDSTTSDQDALNCIAALTEYLWNDEEADYLATTSPVNKDEHIFCTLKLIRGWLLLKKKMLDNSFHTVARRANTSVQIRRTLPEISSEVVFANTTARLQLSCVIATTDF